ncbi:MAG: LysR family transcriptional regulator [Treponema sp.]|nr:LysR family transcriptional regulator [Treponema sp.]
MYELQQVKLFLKFAECGSLKKASEELNMTQPGLSRSMRRLEEELGVSLFVRTSNTISLNENGRKALELFGDLYGKAVEVGDALKLFSESKRTVKVLSPSPTLFPELKRRFAISNPGVEVIAETSAYEGMVEALRNGDCQLIQVSHPVEGDDVYNAVFDEESLCLLLPENHKFSSRKDGVLLSELDGETVLAPLETGYWNNVTEKLLPNSHFIHQKEKTDFETLLVSSTLPTFVTDTMIGSFNDSFKKSGRSIIPLLDEYLNVTVYCCCLLKNRGQFERFFSLY